MNKNVYPLVGVGVVTTLILAVSCSSPPEKKTQDYYQNPQEATNYPQPTQPPSQPIIVQPSAPTSDNSLSSAITYGLLGHALGSAGSSRYNGQGGTRIIERVVERPRYVKPVPAVPKYNPVIKPIPQPPRPVSTPSKGLSNFRSGNWGGGRK